MKKAIFLFLLIAAGAVLFAQTPVQTSTINGTLGVSAGQIAVKSGNNTYYTRGLERFVGFIDGLKDGAQVSMEGYASAPFMEGQTELLFYPVKLTLNGKTYDVGRTNAWNGGGYGYCGGGGRGGAGGFHHGGGYGGRGRGMRW